MLLKPAGIGLIGAALGLGSFAMFDAATALKHLFILAVVPVSLWGLVRLQQPNATNAGSGWRYLSPSPLHWFGLVLCLGLTSLMLYVWLFVGSSRADADTQMKILLGLVVLGGAGSLYMLTTCLAVRIRWNSERIERWLGPKLVASILFSDIAGATALPGDMLRIRTKDGDALAVDPTLNGADDLLEALGPCLERRGPTEAEA